MFAYHSTDVSREQLALLPGEEGGEMGEELWHLMVAIL